MRSQTEPRQRAIPVSRAPHLRLIVGDRRAYYAAKRVMDMLLAALLLIVLLPVMILVAVAIYVYSPGSIIFAQERVGAKRRMQDGSILWEPVTFRCFKFRTMKQDADPAIHRQYVQALIKKDEQEMRSAKEKARGRKIIARQAQSAARQVPTEPGKLTEDDRIIRPGHLLRKLSLDELPQLFNVLRGDMSLIGPRPAIPYEVEVYEPWHLARLQAQPGISGLQQVRARSTRDFDEQVKFDIEYIERQSLWLDLKIAIQTPWAILFGKGAY